MLDKRLTPTRLEPKPIKLLPVQPVSRPGMGSRFYVIYQLAAVNLFLLLSRMWTGVSPQFWAAKIRFYFERMGPVWVSAGKVLAMRSDLLPTQLANELASLRDSGPGFPFEWVQRTMEEELGVPMERYFEQCDKQPFAVSSSFQVHRAVLKREQVQVAIKIQRPFNEQVCKRDLGMLRWMIRFMRWIRLAPRMRWNDLYREVEYAVQRELDFRFEAAALELLDKSLPKQKIYVPQVFHDYSTERILVSEFIQGVTLAQYEATRKRNPNLIRRWSKTNAFNPQKASRRLFQSVFRQIFEDNFFHVDLHPTNVILLRNSRLAVIDCRMTGSLESEQLDKYRMYFSALSRREFATAAEHSFLFTLRLPRMDLGEVTSKFVRIWRQWEMRNNVDEIPIQEKSLTWMLHEINLVVRSNHFQVQWSMAKLVWAMVNADASVMVLARRIDYIEWLAEYFHRADERSRKIEPRSAARGMVMMLDSMRSLPNSLMQSSVAQQEVLRRQSQVFRGSTRKSGYFFSVMYGFACWLLVFVGGLAFSTFLQKFYGVDVENWIGPQLFTVVEWLGSFAVEKVGWILILTALFLLYIRTVVFQYRSRQRDIGTSNNGSTGAVTG